jgi:hypothetical protein
MQQITAESLRQIARKLEEDSAVGLAELAEPVEEINLKGADVRFTQGNLQDFPRALPRYSAAAADDRSGDAVPELMRDPIPAPAAEFGLAVLDDANDRAVAMLYALAAALEANPDLEIPEVLLIPVKPYIEAYSAQKKARRNARSRRT